MSRLSVSKLTPKAWVVIAVVVVVIIGAIILLWPKSDGKSSQKMEIQVTASGFIPSDVVIKAGTQIVWKNMDAAPHSVASNPYPSSSSVPGLHSQTILPEGSYTYTPESASTIQYHDGTQPTHNGSIKVEK